MRFLICVEFDFIVSISMTELIKFCAFGVLANFDVRTRKTGCFTK